MPKLPITTSARSADAEQLQHCARTIGTSVQRLEVFKAIYKNQLQKKTVKHLMDETGLGEKQVRAAVSYLFHHHMCITTGRGKNTIIQKDPFCRKYRDKILRAVNNPSYLEKAFGKPVAAVNAAAVGPAPVPRRASAVRKSRESTRPKLTIAFLTTNPERDLRTDSEYKAVLGRHKESLNREKIALENVSAASLEDLLHVLNNMSPDVVHFSGHGNVGLVVFDGDGLKDEPVEVDFSLLKAALEATNEPPKIVVLNSCFGAIEANDLLGKVQAVVAMNNTIDDTAAAVFARQFYAALFSGQSIDNALNQGKVALKALQFADADFPELITAKGVDSSTIKFNF